MTMLQISSMVGDMVALGLSSHDIAYFVLAAISS